MCQEVAWDPTGRYVATIVNAGTRRRLPACLHRLPCFGWCRALRACTHGLLWQVTASAAAG